MDFRAFVETQLADIERLPGQTPFNLAMRSQGKLTPTDPIQNFRAQNPNVGNLNIVWITGMWSGKIPGTGNYAPLFKSLGYNIRTVSTKGNVFTAGIGRLTHGWTPNFLKLMGQAHIEKNKGIYRQSAQNNPNPDIIIGSSQGGAIALSLAGEHPEVPMLLVCPAWRIFHVDPTTLNSNSIIVHGAYDKEVPIEDSEYLSKKFNVPLFITQDGHIIKKGFWQIVRGLQAISSKVLAKKASEQ